MQDELISIVVPVYNVEKYITKCLDSLLAQTYSNIEIILVDDGSKDQSGAICDEYEKKDKRIRVFHQRNKGVSSARNLALENAKGAYIAFCDSDDWVEPDMYEYLYKLLKETDSQTACCGAWFGNQAVGYAKKDRMVLDTEETIVQLHLRNNMNDWMWTKLVAKEIIGETRFDVNLRVSEDYAFLCEIYKKTQKNVCGSGLKYHYVQRKSSVSNNGYSIEFEKGLKVRKKYLDEFVALYPARKKELYTRYILELMGIVTAMIKGNEYNDTRIHEIQKEIRKNLWTYLTVKGPELYLKVSAVMMCLNVSLFAFIYRSMKKFE